MKSKPLSPPIPPGFRHDLARWRQLVRATWLAGLVAGQPVAAAPRGAWLAFEVGAGAPDAYLRGHVPGAGYIDTNDIERAPLWNAVCDEALLAFLLARGIRHDTTVVLYGRNTLAAARAAHLMLYAGVRDVRLLDAGFAAWEHAGFPVERGMALAPPAAACFGAAFPARADYLADMRRARILLAQPDGVLASIRTWDEFIGATSGYSYIAARGEIAGARWGRAGLDGDVNSMSAFQHADGSMKPAAGIAAMWRATGIGPERHTAFYCGTGWRASLAFFYAWLMGWERISVYDGGWYEWSADPANPVVCRAQPDPSRPMASCRTNLAVRC